MSSPATHVRRRCRVVLHQRPHPTVVGDGHIRRVARLAAGAHAAARLRDDAIAVRDETAENGGRLLSGAEGLVADVVHVKALVEVHLSGRNAQLVAGDVRRPLKDAVVEDVVVQLGGID